MTGQINIIGSSHIAKESVNKVRKEIESYSPDIVALELDPKRAYALLHENKDSAKPRKRDVIRSVGVKGFVIASIGSFAQKKLGNIVGVEPGSEMKTALLITKEKKIKTVFIDQDIEITLQKLSKAITFKVYWQFIKDFFKAIFSKKKLKFDLAKVPEDRIIDEMIKEIKDNYPGIYNVLIDERNKIMAKRLYSLSRNHPEAKILAVVGAGHKSEMINIIKKLEKEN